MYQRFLFSMPAYLLAFFCIVWLTACAKQQEPAAEPLKLQGKTMGTTWRVVVVKPEDQAVLPAPEILQNELQQVLDTVNDQMSTWQKDSELSLFNQYKRTDWFPVSAELVSVVQAAQQLSERSDGVYDITVGPLINLWGFGAARADEERGVPEATLVQAALEKVGYQKLEVRQEPPALRKQVPGLYVDLSSIAKGYGVDQLARYLQAAAVTDFMAEVGGEIHVGGKSPRGDSWRIAIEKPVALGRSVQQGLRLSGGGLATSGDYRNFFSEHGKRYSHTFDPRTGEPVKHRLASVTVLAETTMLADAYATLLMALGEVAGKAFVHQHAIEAYFIWRTDEGFDTFATPGFQQALINAES